MRLDEHEVANDVNDVKDDGGREASRPTDAPQEGAGPAKTLRELGVDGALAGEMEAALRVLGATEGDQVVGFRFRKPDGETVRLRLGTAADGRDTGHRAA